MIIKLYFDRSEKAIEEIDCFCGRYFRYISSGILRYIGDIDFSTISEITSDFSVSVGKDKMSLFRLRVKLRAYWKGKGVHI